MISIDEFKKTKTIVTHANCADGMMSAILLHDVLPSAEILFLTYNTKEHAELEAKPGMLFCDMTPPRARFQEFLSEDLGTIVLDHHVKAKDLVLAFGKRGFFADENEDPGISGAVLAHDLIWHPEQKLRMSLSDNGAGFLQRVAEITDVVELVGIYDTWQKYHSRWMEACYLTEVLRFFPWLHWRDQSCCSPTRYAPTRGDPLDDGVPSFSWWWEEQKRIGQTLLDRKASRLSKTSEGAARVMTTAKLRYMIVNDYYAANDVLEAHKDDIDLAIGFMHVPNQIRISLRSNGKFDCGSFATLHGGGGHTNASGCVITSDSPFVDIIRAIQRYEDH